MLQRGFSANSPAPPVPEPDDHMSAAWQAGPADDLAADSAAAPPPPANTATEPFAAGATDSSATHANPLLPPEDQLGPLPSASPQASEPLAPPQQTAPHPAADEADQVPEPPEGFSDLIIALQVSAPAGGSFSGRDIQSALRRCELEYGEMQIYHYYTPQRRSLFFLANSLEPGSFDLTTMASISTAGLLFFLRLPTVLAGREAFEIMLEVAGKVATQLGGELRDQQGNALGKHELTGIRERIAAYEYKLKAHQRQMALLS
jgi:cell division protein ZipA